MIYPSSPGNPWRVYAWLTMKREMGELGLIEQIRSQWGAAGRAAAGAAGSGSHGHARGVALGIGDDCAILRPPRGHELLVTTDFTLEGRHFRRDLHPPESVGHRTLARGLSDLAAMGARPLAAFLSLALPGEMLSTRAGRAWIRRFFTGLRGLADQSAVPLAGGDTSESPCDQVLADIVLIGSAPAGRALRRSTARAGDALYVTGELGGAAAELAAMKHHAAKSNSKPPRMPGAPPIPRSLRNGWESSSKSSPDQLTAHPQLFPQPRLEVGQALLRRRLATAAIDLSDGLSTDLAHLCRESAVGAEIFSAALPIHPLAMQARDVQASHAAAALNRALELALNGGEDYELLFSAPPTTQIPRTLAGVRITRIGSLVRGSSISLLDSAGRRSPLQPGGWEHFTGKH
jgi:thiamine-monophosphate kinase